MFGGAYCAWKSLQEKLNSDNEHSERKPSTIDKFKSNSKKYYNDEERVFPELTLDEFNKIKKNMYR